MQCLRSGFLRAEPAIQTMRTMSDRNSSKNGTLYCVPTFQLSSPPRKTRKLLHHELWHTLTRSLSLLLELKTILIITINHRLRRGKEKENQQWRRSAFRDPRAANTKQMATTATTNTIKKMENKIQNSKSPNPGWRK